jgi:hypothetical protein
MRMFLIQYNVLCNNLYKYYKFLLIQNPLELNKNKNRNSEIEIRIREESEEEKNK